jgi:glycosyltransferase involved in cell wall biosynthesis
MPTHQPKERVTLSIVIPCYNEENTLGACLKRVLDVENDRLQLEIIVVDDGSQDDSYRVARDLGKLHPQVKIVQHERNLGKGAALKTGIQQAGGDIVAIQDADLEYDPNDLKRLIQPILDGEADAVFGSRFASAGAHRVLYFWHSLGNNFLTLLSNMFTDLNLTDMETCYKVFRRELIQQIDIQEPRFGVEPEIVAKIAHLRPRIFEMGISYAGRTYEEGKKIGIKDGFRALYCIFHYNAPKLPVPMQMLIYLMIGGISAIANIGAFAFLMRTGTNPSAAILMAFFLAAAVNYFLCIALLFRHKARWSATVEVLAYLAVILVAAAIDYGVTSFLMRIGWGALGAKSFSAAVGFVLNFVGRKYLVFKEPSAGPWSPQTK